MLEAFIYSDDAAVAAQLIGFVRGAGLGAAAIAIGQEESDALADCGATVVYQLSGESPLPECYARPIADLLTVEHAKLFLVGATTRGRDLAAQVAGFLDCAMVSDVSGLELSDGRITTERLIYGGAVVQRETVDGFAVVTVPAGRYIAAAGQPEVRVLDVEPDSRVQRVATTPIVRQDVDLAEADRIVSVGMGLERAEDLAEIRQLADELNAGVGCSRGVAEERGWLPEDQYVGISGLSVKPQLYFALGISGQIQHVVGIRESKIIAAVNKDENAPIFRVCDYGIVGDLYEAVRLLHQALRA